MIWILVSIFAFGSAPDPAGVPARGLAARWDRPERGKPVALSLEGAFTISAAVTCEGRPRDKQAILSKWRTIRGGRSYEVGVTPSLRIFFTVSASGSWPEDAAELMATRRLTPGRRVLVTAVYAPGKEMSLWLNGRPSGRLDEKVPPSLFASTTPVLVGTRPGSETACAFDGAIGPVWVHARALAPEEIAALARAVGLDADPGGEIIRRTPPYDLDAIREDVRAWYRGLAAPGMPYGAYRLRPDKPADLYASADIAWIRWMMQDLDLSETERAEWIDFIQDQQDPADGSYRHITGHCKTHAFCHATGALKMLGAEHRYAPALLAPYRRIEGIPAWLDAIDWNRQWGASHDIWGAGLPIACSRETPDAWRQAFFAWLDGENDPATGFWRKGREAKSPLEYLGGAFHIWPIYAALGHPIPHPERVADSVLALVRADGSFDGAWNYGNMDGVWILAHLLRAGVSHRRDDMIAVLDRNIRGLMGLLDESPERFLADAHGTESRIATIAIIQTALPDRFRSKAPWRDPWSVRDLFAIRLGAKER
ncbi:MAG: LamG domain-containing protein [Planctomycetes bacterium]|nr:LamG domain-containing protein [Planctomycetota bacterium]